MTRARGHILGLLVLLFALFGNGPARAQVLVADLSNHLVQVTTGFSGTELLLFGAAQDEGDVVIVIRGPDGPATLRRKARSGFGIWINSDEFTFNGVPSFYKVASSRPLGELKADNALATHQIGLANLQVEGAGARTADTVEDFREALLRNKVRQELFAPEAGEVTFLGDSLFRTRVSFPSNVPTGRFTVTVFLLRAGQVVNAQTIPLIVSKTGIGAEIYEFAHRRSALYGIGAILIALFAGWLASAIFRKA